MNKQTVIRILTWLSILCVLTLVSVVLWSVISGGSQTTTSLLWLQTAQSVATFVLPPILCALLWYKGQWAGWLHLSFSQRRSVSAGGLCALCALLMVVAQPGLVLLSQLNQQITFPEFMAPLEAKLRAMEEAAVAITEQFVKADNAEQFIVTLFVVAVLPAFGEELTFRSLLINFFGKHPIPQRPNSPTPQIAIWVSAILFSAVHMQFFGFVPRMLLGALFGYMLVWSGSLWLPIVMHLTNNALAVLVYNILYWAGADTAVADTFGSGDTLWVGILSLLLTIGGIYCIRKLLRSSLN